MSADHASLLWVDHGGATTLRAIHCAACGTTLFPPQTYGCTTCGAFGNQLEPIEMAARGRLVAFATVYRHHNHPVPFTVGDIELEAGPVVRAELAGNEGWRVGLPVEARVVGDTGAGEHIEFAPAGGTR